METIQQSTGSIAVLLREHAFRHLFIEELGWDHLGNTLYITVHNRSYELLPVAQKRGLAVFQCELDRLELRDRRVLRGIQRIVAKSAHENLVIYTDPGRSRQVWQWARTIEDGRALFHREHPFVSHRPPEEFLRRLLSLRVSIEAEETVSLVQVSRSVADSFDRTADERLFFRNPRYLYESQRLAEALAIGGVEAMHRFVLFHDGLALWMARRFEDTGIDADDLAQIARVGLIQAATRYDPTRDTAFSTYAFHWLRQALQRYIPSHYLAASMRLEQFWRFFRLKQRADRRFWKDGERSVRMGFERAMECDTLVGPYSLDIERVWNTSSYQDSQAGMEKVRAVPDTRPIPESETVRKEESYIIMQAIDELGPVDARIIRDRFGFDGQEQTLKDLGITLGLTRERVRQREFAALKRLGKVLPDRLHLPAPLEAPLTDDQNGQTTGSLDSSATG
ncbi:MAG: sigma-70 family RNA polymerase sigma factor [Phycisphaerae bacterium]|nr:sigma-70 family RNA polymerase sigma factor [Phycisphaerae bacterium]NUQ47145.1 sigma-70 family RNA polymerase sigma factor [Phycisphaerae bacterium]